jgi:outer membrane receptor protein involved in Fe transport
MRSRKVAWLLVALMASGNALELAAAGHAGLVTLAGRAVPGATITLSRGDQRFVTTTDAQGIYQLPDVPDGVWTAVVEMRGFAPSTREITVASGAEPATWTLSMLSAADLTKDSSPATTLPPVAATPAVTDRQAAAATRASTTAATTASNGSPAAASNPAARAPAAAARPVTGTAAAIAATAPVEEARTPDPSTGAADGFVIAGSVNNGAASPFAQSAAFGNFRPGQGRSRYTTNITLFGNSSALNATPYSVSGNREKPDYTTLNVTGTVSGPLQLPGLMKNGPTFQLSYQRTASDNVTTLLGRMPTPAERLGDFSGGSVPIIDPNTGQPFPGNVLPANRISPQAAALLDLYPLPNGEPQAPTNHHAPGLSTSRGHGLTFSTGRSINNRNQIQGTTTYNRSDSLSSSLLGFINETSSSNLGVNGSWMHRSGPFLSFRVTHAFTRAVSETDPYFANRVNISGEAGIVGNDQDPRNWGPPTLNFSGSVSDLRDAAYSSSHSISNQTATEANWTRGRHNYTFGGQVRLNTLDLISQENGRGSFLFAGNGTGSPFADFLLGLPQSSSLAFGNADQRFHAWSYAAYAMDDLRLRPNLTINVGLRWEYEAPLSEVLDRMVNLDVAPGFLAVSPVLASSGVGPLTGREYPSTLVHGDLSGFQPRLSMAWRPILGSSLLVRAGYDRTRSSGAVQTLARMMAQQPPLSTTGNAVTSPEEVLSLSDGFVASPDVVQNTFAVDPDMRIADAQNWQVYVQRDMPASLTLAASYLGTRGGHLVQQFLPNTYPGGALNPCPACPSGFRYVTSLGTSQRHGGRFEIRRRTRNGLTASAQYTLSKATDNASGFGDVGGASTAQNWLDLGAEQGPSSFDQRHLVGAQVTYNTGVGLRALLTNGLRGKLIRNWTIDVRASTGSGLPLTPTFVPATMLTPPVRADVTGATLAAPHGYYLNPAAYTSPGSGTWGNAGRNSGRGPKTLTVDGSVQRSFPMGRTNLDLRFDATNLLNRVVYTSVDTLIGSPQFGLPTGVGSMRRINTRVSLRF